MAMKLRSEQMGGLWNGIRPIHIAASSKMVSTYSGMYVQPHKAIVGANAFAHESGIHQDGMLKSKDTYEIMSPEALGFQRKDSAGIVLGKHSGRHALSTRLRELGFDLNEEQMNVMFKRFKVSIGVVVPRCIKGPADRFALLPDGRPAGAGGEEEGCCR